MMTRSIAGDSIVVKKGDIDMDMIKENSRNR